MHIVSKNLHTKYELNATQNKGVIEILSCLPWQRGIWLMPIVSKNVNAKSEVSTT